MKTEIPPKKHQKAPPKHIGKIKSAPPVASTRKVQAPKEIKKTPTLPPATPDLSEEEELLLIEEDGDFFWVIQNILWGIFKTVAILGGIGLLIWFIWGDSDENDVVPAVPVETTTVEESISLWEQLFGKAEEDTPQTNPTPSIPTPTPTPNKPQINPSKTVFINSNHVGVIAAQKNAILEEKAFGSQNSIENGMLLLRKMDDIFQVPLLAQISAPTQQAREAKINAFLLHIHDLIKKSVNMRSLVTTEYLQEEGLANQYAQEAIISANQITNALSYAQPQGISALLERNIAIENQAYTQNASVDVKKAIISRLQGYENALRSISENVISNKDALILDIQVVEYNKDPFGRVLSPAQWKAGTPQ
jgi:hypothetical protein